MRERLADTLDYVFEEVGGALGVSPRQAADATSRIRRSRQSPNLFGAYYEMVLALESDEIDEARAFACELLASADASGTRIAAIEERSASEAARYRRLLISDPDMARQPDTGLLAETRVRVDAAFDLLDRGFPEMSGEIRELLREIAIAQGPEDPKAPTFDGASSYMLWGAILLNARGQKTVLDTAQALAHESGHNLLFGLCVSGPLVENADDELFSSPLRSDLRPMDGVVHATYVVARMHQTVSRLLQAGAVDEADMDGAVADLEAHRRNFEAGEQVVRESGRLTPLGARVIESARAYMAAAAESRTQGFADAG
jgi:HEXXH motif-containing protein